MHTPGPWRVERQNPSPTTGQYMIAGTKPGYLAEIRDCGSGDIRANAHLIAAAPDLLDALGKCRRWIAQYHDLPGHDAASRCLTDYLDKIISTTNGE